MKSTLLERLQLTYSPVAIHLTDEKPEGAIQFKEGNIRGCTAAVLVAAATQKRSAAFDRKHFGCPGGGVGRKLPGDRDMAKNPETKEMTKGIDKS